VLLDRARVSTVSRGSDHDELMEVRANSFAATFLMPNQGVREFLSGLGKGHSSRSSAEIFDDGAALLAEGRTTPGSQDLQLYDLVQVAHHFGVSRLSALYRLKNLRIVSQSEFDRLKALEDSGKGAEVARLLKLREPDHEVTRDEFVHRFVGLALEAFRRELISRAKLFEIAEQVGVDRVAIGRLLEQVGLGDG
jgi:Zn-dependent peptidase ImmA (M78 family)